jgi:hypothetical protein
MSDQNSAQQQARPAGGQTSQPIDFQKVSVVPGVVNDTWILNVAGEAPCANMEVTLDPAVYITQPEYWEIQVTGTLPDGICLEAIKPYEVSLDITGTIGKIGIEVVGATRRKKIDVPPGTL